MSNRKLYIEMNGVKSDLLNVEFGSAQGSVLGPIIYNFFTNDSRKMLKYSQCICFAGDTTIFLCGNNIKATKANLKMYLQSITTYFK